MVNIAQTQKEDLWKMCGCSTGFSSLRVTLNKHFPGHWIDCGLPASPSLVSKPLYSPYHIIQPFMGHYQGASDCTSISQKWQVALRCGSSLHCCIAVFWGMSRIIRCCMRDCMELNNAHSCLWHKVTHQIRKKLRGLSPRANYTDRAAAAGRRS